VAQIVTTVVVVSLVLTVVGLLMDRRSGLRQGKGSTASGAGEGRLDRTTEVVPIEAAE